MQERHILGAVRAHNRKVHGTIDVFDTVCQLEQELDRKDKRIDWLERQLSIGNISNRIKYTVCEKCNNRNAELLDTVDQLERELARLGRRDRALSAMSASYKRKLKRLVDKFRKLKMQHAGYPLLLSMKDTRIKELEQENTILQSKLEQHWIASRTHKSAKENNMAKLDITMDELGAGDMAVRGVSLVIDGISAEDAARVSLRFLSAIDPMEADDPETPQHVCTCHANDEDKRPSSMDSTPDCDFSDKLAAYLAKIDANKNGKVADNAFAPMDVDET